MQSTIASPPRQTGRADFPRGGADIVFSCRRLLEGTYPKRVRRPSAQECQRIWIPAQAGMTVDGMTVFKRGIRCHSARGEPTRKPSDLCRLLKVLR
jgi:hypothetical protein